MFAKYSPGASGYFKKKWLSGIMKIVMVIDKSILFMFL
jgi:hypothetical protein